MLEHLDDASIKMIIAVVTGVLALVGAFGGAFLSRRTERIKWLRQSRSDAFAEFLNKVSKAQSEAIDTLQDASLESLQRDIRVTEIYAILEINAQVVRLYLPKSKRDEFSHLVREIQSLHSTVDLGSSRLAKMGQRIERIQSMFEQTLDS